MADFDVRAQELRAQGLVFREIAEGLGISKRQAWLACNRTTQAADNKARRAYKREHERSHRSPCSRCGEPMGVGSASPSRTQLLCRACYDKAEAQRIARRDRQLETMWAAGLSVLDIADRLGWSRGHVQAEFDCARRRGANLPYRYRGKRNGTKFPALRRAA